MRDVKFANRIGAAEAGAEKIVLQKFFEVSKSQLQ